MRVKKFFDALLWAGFLAGTACDRPVGQGENAPQIAPPSSPPAASLEKKGTPGIPVFSEDSKKAELLPAFSWPPGWTVTSQGCALSGNPEVLWMEVEAPVADPEEAVRRTLSIMTPGHLTAAMIDVAPSPDGRTATGQIADPLFHAVVTAKPTEKGTHLQIAFQRSLNSR